MQSFIEHSAAALAAVIIVTLSLGQVISVPPAQTAQVVAQAPTFA